MERDPLGKAGRRVAVLVFLLLFVIMKPEYDAALCEEFPLLYRDRHRDWRDTPMGFGIECGEGWFQLLRELSGKLEALIEKLPAEIRSDYRAAQVKEKLGALTVHMTGATAEMMDAIHAAREASEHVCEMCGASGSLRTIGAFQWLKTLCDAHYQEREARSIVRH